MEWLLCWLEHIAAKHSSWAHAKLDSPTFECSQLVWRDCHSNGTTKQGRNTTSWATPALCHLTRQLGRGVAGVVHTDPAWRAHRHQLSFPTWLSAVVWADAYIYIKSHETPQPSPCVYACEESKQKESNSSKIAKYSKRQTVVVSSNGLSWLHWID